jgi:hypothetical protein
MAQPAPNPFAGSLKLRDLNNGTKVRLTHFIMTSAGQVMQVPNFPAVYTLSNKRDMDVPHEPYGIQRSVVFTATSDEIGPGQRPTVLILAEGPAPDAYAAPELLADRLMWAPHFDFEPGMTAHVILKDPQAGGKRNRKNTRRNKNRSRRTKNRRNSRK